MPVPPEGFLDLARIAVDPPEGYVDIIGLVDSCDQLRQTRTGDVCWNLHLQDTQLKTATHLDYERGFRVCFFVREAPDLPPVTTQGDIIMLRNVKPSKYNGRTFLQNDKFLTSILVFPRATVPAPEFKEAYMGGKQQLIRKGAARAKAELSLQEIQYIIELSAAHNELITPDNPTKLAPSNNTAVAQPSPSSESTAIAPNRRPGIIGTPYGGAKRIALASSDHDFEQTKINTTKALGKFRLMSEVDFEPGRETAFVDMCVEILRKYHDGYTCEILVSDYTENNMLPNRPPPEDTREQDGYESRSRKDFAGPYGQRVLKIVLETPHKEFVRDNVQLGEFVLLQNVKLKQDKYRHLQGDLWTDRSFPNKLCVQRIFNKGMPVVRDIIQRKTAYFDSRRTIDGPDLQAEQSSSMQPAKSAAQLAAEKAIKKKEKRHRQKERRDAAARAAEQTGANSHVRCSQTEKDLTSVRDILDPYDRRHTNKLPQGLFYKLPFSNASFRAKVRVLDYHPAKLEDFAVRVEDSPTNHDIDDIDEQTNTPSWEWNFQLLVQDATITNPSKDDKITVDIGHLQAQFLLGSAMPEPGDLRKDPVLLAKLRERMSIIWGDLHEQKQQDATDSPPSNRPFECCISEYGMQQSSHVEDINAWTRRYMLHGVTIV